MKRTREPEVSRGRVIPDSAAKTVWESNKITPTQMPELWGNCGLSCSSKLVVDVVVVTGTWLRPGKNNELMLREYSYLRMDRENGIRDVEHSDQKSRCPGRSQTGCPVYTGFSSQHRN